MGEVGGPCILSSSQCTATSIPGLELVSVGERGGPSILSSMQCTARSIPGKELWGREVVPVSYPLASVQQGTLKH